MKTTKTIDEQVKAIHDRMYKHRLDQNRYHDNGWTFENGRRSVPKRQNEEIIREHLRQGHLVTSGYYCTAVRGFHEYYVLWKPRKTRTTSPSPVPPNTTP